jgi:hypothetical protein
MALGYLWEPGAIFVYTFTNEWNAQIALARWTVSNDDKRALTHEQSEGFDLTEPDSFTKILNFIKTGRTD